MSGVSQYQKYQHAIASAEYQEQRDEERDCHNESALADWFSDKDVEELEEAACDWLGEEWITHWLHGPMDGLSPSKEDWEDILRSEASEFIIECVQEAAEEVDHLDAQRRL